MPYVLQALESNAPVAGEGALRLLKLHGSREDWMRVVLSGRSYQGFGRSYPFLSAQLDVLLRQRAVLFVGCSLQDPRLLDWLAVQTEEGARGLKPWRALMTAQAWRAEAAATWERGHASGLWRAATCRPLVLRDHAHLFEPWGEVAAAVAPELRRLAIADHHETPRTIGEHLKKKAHLHRGVRQKDAARAVGRDPGTLLDSEQGRAAPEGRFLHHQFPRF